MWHEKYSLLYTVVLGFVGCRVTSKLCGIGPAKRSWGGVKQIKDGVRSHLGGESTEKRSVIYVTTKIQESRMHQHQMENLDAHGQDAMFGECENHWLSFEGIEPSECWRLRTNGQQSVL